MRSMRVGIIAGTIRSLILFRVPLINALLSNGHSVYVFAPQGDSHYHHSLTELGAHVRIINFAADGLNPWQDLQFQRALTSRLRSERLDAVLAYTAKPVVYGIPAAHAAGIPVRVPMITGLGYAFGDDGGVRQRLVGYASRQLYRRALKKATYTLFQNPDDFQEFQKLGLIQSEVAGVISGSGVDTDYFRYSPAEVHDNVQFTMMARLIEEKGVRVFAEAASIVRQSRRDCSFTLYGEIVDGPRGVPKEDISDWVKSGTLTFVPWVKDVREALAACHVYVLPSYYREGVPRSILEALAVGRPVITTDAPGCRETVHEGRNGILVPPKDAHALAAAMAKLADAPQMRNSMGIESRKLAERRFDSAIVNDSILRALGAIRVAGK